MSVLIAPPRTFGLVRIGVVLALALLVLTALTVGLAQVDLGPFGAPVALTIAFGKAALVVTLFMHVKDATRSVWLYAALGFYFFAILIVLTLADVLTRGWGPIGT